MVEAELVVGAIGDVGKICLTAGHGTEILLLNEEAASCVALLVDERFSVFFHVPRGGIKKRARWNKARYGKSQCAVNLSHPYGIATGKVFIHGHNVHAFPLKRTNVCRCNGCKRFPFAG